MSVAKISKDTYDDIVSRIVTLEALDSPSPDILGNIEAQYTSVIAPLLSAEGYEVKEEKFTSDRGRDLQAFRDSEKLVFEYKFRRGKSLIGVNYVSQLLGTASYHGFTKAIVLANTGFTAPAQDLARQMSPLNIQLLNLEAIRAWAMRLYQPEDNIHSEVSKILRDASRKMAEMIARDRNTLGALEWRDVERVMAEVFDGLGFNAELTPPSKDGGKDIVLTCTVFGRIATYYVEIKHWRSATRVGSSAITDLLNVVVSEKIDGGLFLSTYGFATNAFEQLTMIDKAKINFGTDDKVVNLCKSYVRARAGVWSQPQNLSDLIMDG